MRVAATICVFTNDHVTVEVQRCRGPPSSARRPCEARSHLSQATTRSSRPQGPRYNDRGTHSAQIVAELDRYIVGQQKAKRAVAIALRNRWRRRRRPARSARRGGAKNIIMIGPTGVRKTEVAATGQALASAVLESRSLQVHRGRLRRARRRVDDPRPDRAVGEHGQGGDDGPRAGAGGAACGGSPARRAAAAPDRAVLVELARGDHARRLARDDQGQAPPAAPSRKAGRPARRARDAAAIAADDRGPVRPGHGGDGHQPQGHALEHHAEPDQAPEGARGRGAAAPGSGGSPEARGHGRGGIPGHPAGRELGIIFLDELDKVAGRKGATARTSVGRVQRDLLPIVEGSSVTTKYGVVRRITSCSSPPVRSTSPSRRT